MPHSTDPFSSPAGPFESPAWLPGAHAQTIVPLWLSQRCQVPYRRELLDTPDGEQVALDWAEPASAPPGNAASAASSTAPLLVLFHGLEGSSQSHYARRIMHHTQQRGWLGVVFNFRGCGGMVNRVARTYHSGDSAEIDWVLRTLQARFPHRPLLATGVSLGGNALLKWLGERGEAARSVVQAAAALSTPFDLDAVCLHLARGANRAIYTRHFLSTLIPAAARLGQKFPGLFSSAELARVRHLYAFDDLVTARVNGFASAAAYYRESSSKPWLHAVRVPTLLLNARNDPFIPPQVLPKPGELSPHIRFALLASGGHAGFVARHRPLRWMPEAVCTYLAAQLATSG